MVTQNKAVNIYLDSDTWKEFRKLMIDLEMSASENINNYIKDYVKGEKWRRDTST